MESDGKYDYKKLTLKKGRKVKIDIKKAKAMI